MTVHTSLWIQTVLFYFYFVTFRLGFVRFHWLHHFLSSSLSSISLSSSLLFAASETLAIIGSRIIVGHRFRSASRWVQRPRICLLVFFYIGWFRISCWNCVISKKCFITWGFQIWYGFCSGFQILYRFSSNLLLNWGFRSGL